MNHDSRALGLLAHLARGLVRHGELKTKADLGDRSAYVGLSDVGRAVTCLRAAVAGKMKSPLPDRPILDVLRRQLVLQRGHWLEAGLESAFRANGANLVSQLEIIAPGPLPLRAHVDFTFVGAADRPVIRILELKSTEHLPRTLYPGYEAQIHGQIGLLAQLWNQPAFTVPGLRDQTFPQLCRHLFGIDLPSRAAEVDLEGWVLCLSMSDARPFGPYRPDPTMLKLCHRTAHRLWQGVQDVKAGRINLDDLDTCAGFHPLCDWCDHAEGCPKFTADPVSDPALDRELAEFSRLKAEKSVLEAEIEMREARIRRFFRHAGRHTGWLSTGNFRFKTAHIAGRKTIDAGKLRAVLTNRLGVDQADALLSHATTTGADYERLTVTSIKESSP
jgi:hypothetical protein